MEFFTLNHLLIGLPGSGKSTFAEILATLCDDAVIISSDRARQTLYGDETIQGNWQEIESELLQQVQTAIAQGKTVIYDATNAKRAHRLDWLQKMETLLGQSHAWMGWYLQTSSETAKEWNQKRDRQVPEGVIDRMQTTLKRFPPHASEGFVKVQTIDVRHPETAKSQAKTVIEKLARSRTQQQNRTSEYELHRYSRLLDFERLMHLIALMIQYPGVGKLRETSPETLEQLLGENHDLIEDDIAEVQAVMARLKGGVYADRDAIAADLEWLNINGLLATEAPQENLQALLVSDQELTQLQQRVAPWHRYSDLEPFQRLLKLIRYIAQHPFQTQAGAEIASTGSEKKRSGLQQRLFQKIHNDGVLQDYGFATLRKDFEQVLKPYQILPGFTMKRGYFFGTGIFSQQELEKIYDLLNSQQVYLNDPAAVEMAKRFRERIESSRLLDSKEIYPSRAIGNWGIVNTDRLPARALPNQLDVLENAIKYGEKLELALTPGSARFPGQPELDRFEVYPLQVVFHNIAWYLGYERVGGEQDGLLRFERLDRLTLERKTGQTRNLKSQRRRLDQLKQLYTASAGIFLGTDVSQQRKYLSKNQKERQSVEMTVELWMTERIYKFVSEGNQRFPKSQMRMTRPPNQATQATDSSIFRLSKSKDRDFPYRFRVTLPIWSMNDVDLKRWVLGFAGQVKVIQPQTFRDKIATEVEATWKNYCNGED